MKHGVLSLSVILSLLVAHTFAVAEESARVEMFSPQGAAKKVRQVTVRFSEQMVPFGDPRLVEPFDVGCPEKGRGRWADGRNWLYDFDEDLPAGVNCEFVLKQDMLTLSGKALDGQREFSFSTGGPSIIESRPEEGAESLDESQIFLLKLDAEATEESVLSHVSCSIEGITERVGVSVVKGGEAEKILRQYREFRDAPRVLLRCRQSFPNGAIVRLLWGKGVSSPSGVKTTEEQALSFRSREPFTAKFGCERENARANCIPVLPMRLRFTAPVPWDSARKIVLRGGGKNYRPQKASSDEDEEGEGEASPPAGESSMYAVSFKGPFPENSSFVIEIPGDVRDDAGRTLSNRDSFPLTVKTDAYPPLAKFASRFGIIELKGDATLPVTLRNIEPEVKTRILRTDRTKEGVAEKTREGLPEKEIELGGSSAGPPAERPGEKSSEAVEGLKGRLRKIRPDREETVIEWLRKVASAERERAILKGEGEVREFSLPKPGGAQPFEVVGIPLKDPGFYVVEMESRILGKSLLDKQKPVFVPTATLVTNLSAHFKWGRESSLVWVTTLDKAEPVKEAVVTVRDCNGKVLWKGSTDERGIARIKKQLPTDRNLPRCRFSANYGEVSHALQGLGGGLFVFARTARDMTFVHSSWAEGIEAWRYNLPHADYRGPAIAHTVFDRTLLRAGETVHMKHFLRKHTTTGFSLLKEEQLPGTVVIQHLGSEQRYESALKWDGRGVSETEWSIPREAKLGHYRVSLLKKAASRAQPAMIAGGHERGDEEYFSPDGRETGSFRVEEYRIPLMKALIEPPKESLVNAKEAEVDLVLTYLSGGGAGNAPVKLRSQVQPRHVHFEDYEDFTFANGEVKEGVTRRSRYEEGDGREAARKPRLSTSELTLGGNGSLRAKVPDLPSLSQPHDLSVEMEFRDPNGEVQTVSRRVPLWPSRVLLGIKPDSWALSREGFKFRVVALDLSGRPLRGREVKVDLYERKSYSHRKRLVGGFYSYEHVSETKTLSTICEGKTDAGGLVLCEATSPVSGNVILQARALDDWGNPALTHRDLWVAGKGEWWFDVSDRDRMDLLPEKKRYEPGEVARLQVRMPFRSGTALITVEREGVMETFVRKVSGKTPVIAVPVKESYAPNVFVSALVVRGRVSGTQPTAMVDLGKPAFKLGIAEIRVGWRAHELKVSVSSDRETYRVRERAKVKVKARRANGNPPPKGSEATVVAVDEGLLELIPNGSWRLLDAMMGRRGYEVQTSTAQTQVVGKRHYGLKALPQGGGGGRQATRELFDTLLLWKARVPLDDTGEAEIEVPLNDSLTSFRIVAVAHGGAGLFGTGQTNIRTTQDLILLSSLPHLVREGDRFTAGFTVRNASDRKMGVEVNAVVRGIERGELAPINETLSPGEAKEMGWDIQAPYGVDALSYDVSAAEKDGEARDSMKVVQRVGEAVAVRTFQATLAQVENTLTVDIERPKDATAGKGGVNVSLRPRLSDGLESVALFMKQYPYTCMEQKVSRAVALRDESLWKKVAAELPAHLDADGLVKYFPSMPAGSDVLTSYIVSIAHESGWEIPAEIREKMEQGLEGFVEGRVIRHSSLPTADLSMRKLAAVEALSRKDRAEARLLNSITIEPNLWPTSAVIDWVNVLLRVKDIPGRDRRLREAEQTLRSRMNFQGTTMGFSTEGSDRLWWLMVSADLNAVRSILTLLHFDSWSQDMPRLVTGVLGRQHRGAWNLTTANAWGVLAMEKFSKKFEALPVTGATSAGTEKRSKTLDWATNAEGGSFMLGWPKRKERLTIEHRGTGKPWATVQSLAAVPLREPYSNGYVIRKTLIPVQQKTEGAWSRGDVVKVKLDLEAQADMTWIVVNDPIPAGSSILGTGLGRDSRLLTQDEKREGYVWPAFEERSFEAFRAYYEFAPKGKWTVEYTVRLNNPGTFHLPATRVEALYAPEMLGEMPNARMKVGP